MLTRFNVSNLTDFQKIFFGLAGASVVLLLLAICNVLFFRHGFPYGFYVFMRIVTCGSLIGLMLEKFPTWVKFVLLLLAILYNPVVPIHIGDREIWAWFNAATIPVLVALWCVIFKRLEKI